MSRSVSKVDDGGQGYEKASKRLMSLHAMGLAMARRYAATQLDLTRYKV